MAAEPGRDDVLAAREAIAGRLHRTPMFSSATLSERVGAPVHLKAELFQRTGSFKPRGVLTKLASLSTEEKRRGVIGISAGNHAQALAYCAALERRRRAARHVAGRERRRRSRRRARTAPRSTSKPAGPAEAFERLDGADGRDGPPARPSLRRPDDDRRPGHRRPGDRSRTSRRATVIVVPVGGGGLISGIALAAEGRRVVAVEPELSDALHRGLEAGESVPVQPNSIADGLSAPFAGELRDPDLRGARRRERPRHRGRDRRRDALPLRPREARLRAGRGGRSGGAPGRKSGRRAH